LEARGALAGPLDEFAVFESAVLEFVPLAGAPGPPLPGGPLTLPAAGVLSCDPAGAVGVVVPGWLGVVVTGGWVVGVVVVVDGDPGVTVNVAG
jgi:hypothetical protein